MCSHQSSGARLIDPHCLAQWTHRHRPVCRAFRFASMSGSPRGSSNRPAEPPAPGRPPPRVPPTPDTRRRRAFRPCLLIGTRCYCPLRVYWLSHWAMRRFGAVSRHDSVTISATSPQSRSMSRRSPTQPRGPTYGGMKNLSGSSPTSSACTPGVALNHSAGRPSSGCSCRLANAARPTIPNVGIPWLSRSSTFGNLRQISRNPGRSFLSDGTRDG